MISISISLTEELRNFILTVADRDVVAYFKADLKTTFTAQREVLNAQGVGAMADLMMVDDCQPLAELIAGFQIAKLKRLSNLNRQILHTLWGSPSSTLTR